MLFLFLFFFIYFIIIVKYELNGGGGSCNVSAMGNAAGPTAAISGLCKF